MTLHSTHIRTHDHLMPALAPAPTPAPSPTPTLMHTLTQEAEWKGVDRADEAWMNLPSVAVRAARAGEKSSPGAADFFAVESHAMPCV